MKTFILITLLINSAISEEKISREGTEWCNIWMNSATSSDKPRLLLVGDSITNAYFNPVSKQLKEKAYCAKLTTSACVSDPIFLEQLAIMFNNYKYEVIHFNNGLHGFGYTEEEYKAGYEKVLKFIQKTAPKAKIVLALSTPLKSTSPQNSLNPRVDKRNEIVRDLAKAYGAEINDLHSISKGHPEYYSDPYHYKAEAVKLQSKQVVKTISK
ncbi:MAG: SGNH/GDSL hydrolase family protein [Lentisphaeraceae bacterium]|nr:SGNH/GDSL hydrolase family protein [Lentisphaeraceae bacterium]